MSINSINQKLHDQYRNQNCGLCYHQTYINFLENEVLRLRGETKEEPIKYEDLVKGEIYHTDGNNRCYPVIFRHGFDLLSEYGYTKAIDFKTECPIHKATIIKKAELTRAELDNNDFWDGKELIKLKS